MRLTKDSKNVLKVTLAIFLLTCSIAYCQADLEGRPITGKSVAEFITPDGRFDLEAARLSGYQGSLDMEGFAPSIDPVTGQPVFMPSSQSYDKLDHPDDIYHQLEYRIIPFMECPEKQDNSIRCVKD